MTALRVVSLILISLLLAACGSRYQAPVDQIGDGPRFLDNGRTHRVNGGETLYVIAWMYDLDVNALARANNLRAPYTVESGQILSVDLRSQTVAATAVQQRAVTVTAATGINRPSRTALPATTGSTTVRTPLPAAGDSRAETLTPAPSASQTPVEAPQVRVQQEVPQEVPQQVVPQEMPAENTVNNTRVSPLPQSSTQPGDPASSPQQGTPGPEPAAETPAGAPAIAIATAPVTARVETVPTPVPASENISWGWPHSGTILRRFSDDSVVGKGLDLAGNAGDSVMAAADGEIVYAGGGLLRYGNLIIVKHDDHFLSAYAHNRSLNVKEGDLVRKGQQIAELGSSGIDRNMLHFEIREDGKPIDPALYLPRR